MKRTSPTKRRNTRPDALSPQKSFGTPGNVGSDWHEVHQRTFSVHSRKIPAERASDFARTAFRTRDHSVFSSAGCGKFARLHFVSWRGSLFACALSSHRRAGAARRVPHLLYAVSG